MSHLNLNILQSLILCTVTSEGHAFLLTELTFYIIRKWLHAPMISKDLLYQKPFQTRPVITADFKIIARSDWSWFVSLAKFKTKPDSKDKTSRWVLDLLLRDLWFAYKVSSTIVLPSSFTGWPRQYCQKICNCFKFTSCKRKT